MASQRLSKLQKWILEQCFKVTILFDRTELEELKNTRSGVTCRECNLGKDAAVLERNQNNCIVGKCARYDRTCHFYEFFKEDILLSYFHLPPDNSKWHMDRVQHFHRSPDYTKVHVTVSRSIKNLIEKELIYTWNAYDENSLQICLTDSGIIRAAELLGAHDYYIPEPLSDEVCEVLRQETERKRNIAMSALKAALC